MAKKNKKGNRKDGGAKKPQESSAADTDAKLPVAETPIEDSSAHVQPEEATEKDPELAKEPLDEDASKKFQPLEPKAESTENLGEMKQPEPQASIESSINSTSTFDQKMGTESQSEVLEKGLRGSILQKSKDESLEADAASKSFTEKVEAAMISTEESIEDLTLSGPRKENLEPSTQTEAELTEVSNDVAAAVLSTEALSAIPDLSNTNDTVTESASNLSEVSNEVAAAVFSSEVTSVNESSDRFAAVSSEIDDLFEALGVSPSGDQVIADSAETVLPLEATSQEHPEPLAVPDIPKDWASSNKKFGNLVSETNISGGSLKSSTVFGEGMEGASSAELSEMTLPGNFSTTETSQPQGFGANPDRPFEPFSTAQNTTEADFLHSGLFEDDGVSFDQLLAQPSNPAPPPVMEAVPFDNEVPDQTNFNFFDQTSAGEDPSASFFDSLGENSANPFNSHMSTLANQFYTSVNSGQTLYGAENTGYGHHGDGTDQVLAATSTEQTVPEIDYRDALASRASGYVSYEEQRNLFSFSALPSQRSVVEKEQEEVTGQDYSSYYQEQYTSEYPNQYESAYDAAQHTGYQASYLEGQQVDYQTGYHEGQNADYQTGYQEGYPAEYQGDYQNGYQADYQGQYQSNYQTSYPEGYQAVYQSEHPSEYQDYPATYTEGYQDPYQAEYTDQHQTGNQYSQGVESISHDAYYQSNAGQQDYYQYAHPEATVDAQYYGAPQSATDPAQMASQSHFNNAYSESVPQLNEVQDISPEHHDGYSGVASYEGSDHNFSLTHQDYTNEPQTFASDAGVYTETGVTSQQLTKNNSEQLLENVTLSDENQWRNVARVAPEPNEPLFQTTGLDDLVMPAEAASNVPLPNSPDNLSDLRHGRPACGLFYFGFGGQTAAMVPKVVTRFGAEGTGSTKVYPSNITLATMAFDVSVEPYCGPLCSDSKEADRQATEILQNWASQSSGAGATLLSNLIQLFLQRDGKWEGANDAICDLLRPDLIPLQEFNPPEFTAPSTSLVPQLHKLLLQGQRQEAARLAGSQGAWGHALVIASCAGKELWQETVQAFTRNEAADCEGLAFVYGLFAGLGKYAVNEVAGRGTWKEKLAFIFANRTSGDGVALCALGDELLATDTAAAHACYLLANGAAIHGPLDAVGLRFVLIGAPLSSNLTKANHALRLTECYELALTKSGTPGLNFLQAYKLHRAWALAGAGHLDDALSYCEAISAIITPHPPSTSHYHNVLRTQLGELVDRIKHANGFKPSDSAWIKKRPTFGSFMNAMEGRINQLVMGDDITPSSPTMELQPGPTVFRNNAPQHPSGMMFKEDAIHRSISTERFGIPQRSLLDSHPAGRRSASPHLMSSPFSHARHLTSPFGHNARQPSPNNAPDGLFSPLAVPSIPQAVEQPLPSSPQRAPTPADADDFGFGNAASKPKPAPTQAAKEPAKQEDSGDAGGLFGGIWNTLFGAKSSDQKTVYKAKLGEENSFYYDEAQKRWINKVHRLLTYN